LPVNSFAAAKGEGLVPLAAEELVGTGEISGEAVVSAIHCSMI
jgi:hypothetical protein